MEMLPFEAHLSCSGAISERTLPTKTSPLCVPWRRKWRNSQVLYCNYREDFRRADCRWQTGVWKKNYNVMITEKSRYQASTVKIVVLITTGENLCWRQGKSVILVLEKGRAVGLEAVDADGLPGFKWEVAFQKQWGWEKMGCRSLTNQSCRPL